MLLCYLCFVPIQSYAQGQEKGYTVQTVPNVKRSSRDAYTSDPKGILGAQWVKKLDSLAATINKETDVELAVVVLPRISSEYSDEREFANKLFNYWGIGKKGVDNGLLLLLIVNESHREITFEVGYGLEGTLPDGLCKLIQTRVMVPLMKEGNYGAGLVAGVEEIQRILNNSSDIKTEYDKGHFFDKLLGMRWYALGLLVVIFLNIAFWNIRKDELKERANSGKNNNSYFRYAKSYDAKAFNIETDISSIIAHILLSPLYLLMLPTIINRLISVKRLKKQFKNEVICENCKAVGTNEVIDTSYNLLGEEIIEDAEFDKRKKEDIRKRKGIKEEDEEDEDYTKKKHYATTWILECQKCGHVHEEFEESEVIVRPFNNPKSLYYIDPYSSDGDSDSGGDWGGGSSGGGGSSTSF